LRDREIRDSQIVNRGGWCFFKTDAF